MRLPAVAIAAVFSGGIALGLHLPATQYGGLRLVLASGFAIVLVLLIVSFILAIKNRLFAAAVLGAMTWLVLGMVGAALATQEKPADHVLSQIKNGEIDIGTPLRWHGVLRDEPTKLPWGYGYEVGLSGVEYGGALRNTGGGLRLSYSPRPQQVALPELHAGDEIVALTQAKLPPTFKDEGAFDRRAYLAQQNIHLVATLRSAELLERTASPRPGIAAWIARVRQKLRGEIDMLFPESPETAGVLRAMLLGDRSFVEQAESVDFQKAGAFHVLVVAGLHVGAIAFALFWLGRKLRLSVVWNLIFILAALLAYVAMVEQRPPVMRAALMTAIVVLGSVFYRRLDLLNSAGIAAVILLVASPGELVDTSFQLTFVAICCIAGIAAPCLERRVLPYARALRAWRDVTRDAAHEPRAAQFRIDLRSIASWISGQVPGKAGAIGGNVFVGGLSGAFWIFEMLVVTLALQLGMLPMMAGDFHRVTLAAPVVNLMALPITALLVPLGFLALIGGAISISLGKLLAVPLGLLTRLLLFIVQWFAHFKSASFRIPGPPVWLTVFFVATLILLAAALRLSQNHFRWAGRIAILVLLATGSVIAIHPFAPVWERGKLEVVILDVGQGDSLFVVSPAGKTMLVDGGGAFQGFPGQEKANGNDPGEEAVSPYLWSRGFQKIDVVALTHAHQDHLGGLPAILENFHVGSLWIGREVSSTALTRLKALARGKGVHIEHEVRGKEFAWDNVKGEFLWPEIPAGEIGPAAKNNDSLVLRLQYKNRAILLPGDAEKQAGRQILAGSNSDAVRTDILKVGHHGSKNSTTPDFLDAVHPHVAVISAGQDNPYGHPSPELLERLEGAGIRILRTDRDGAVRILTDGEQIEIRCYVACPENSSSASLAKTKPPDSQQSAEKQ